MQVGPGAPLTALTRETGLMDMGLRVDMEKVMFVLFIRSLDEDSLSRKMYEEQKEKSWPGLAKETKDICERLKVEDVNESIKQTENKEKCNTIMKDDYGRQKYINDKTIYEAELKCSHSQETSNMIKGFRTPSGFVGAYRQPKIKPI